MPVVLFPLDPPFRLGPGWIRRLGRTMKSSENGTRAFSCSVTSSLDGWPQPSVGAVSGWGRPSYYRLRRILTAGRYRCEMARIRYNPGLKIKVNGVRMAPDNGKGYSDGSEL